MRKQLRAAWEFSLALVTRFREERVTQTSGSLTYTTLLALVPMFTVALAVSTAFPVFDQWTLALQLFILENVLPENISVGSDLTMPLGTTDMMRVRVVVMYQQNEDVPGEAITELTWVTAK